MESPGSRIQVVGPSCAGKSTLAEELARRIGAPFVELDALFWKPGWTEPHEEEFAEKLRTATSGVSWVLAGNYFRHTSELLWVDVETVIWLDFPLRTVLPRIIRRSWRRSRDKELLWGTNYERFWPQLKAWSMDSLIGYAIRRHRQYGMRLTGAMRDPRFGHIRWVRLRSAKEVDRWLSQVR